MDWNRSYLTHLPHTTTRPKAPMGLYYEGGRNLPRTTRNNRMPVALIGYGSRLTAWNPAQVAAFKPNQTKARLRYLGKIETPIPRGICVGP